MLFPTEDWSKIYMTIAEMEADLVSKDGSKSFVFNGEGWYSCMGDWMLVTSHPCGGYKVYVWNWNGADPRDDMRAILSLPFRKDF